MLNVFTIYVYVQPTKHDLSVPLLSQSYYQLTHTNQMFIGLFAAELVQGRRVERIHFFSTTVLEIIKFN